MVQAQPQKKVFYTTMPKSLEHCRRRKRKYGRAREQGKV